MHVCMHVCHNWQMAMLPQSGGGEFDPAGSAIIYPLLCGFICVSLCQSIKCKPTNINMYIANDRARFKINTHRC